MKFRNAVLGATLLAGFALPTVTAADPTADQLMAASPDQLRAVIQQLPPEVRDQIRQQLQTKSPEELMSLSPEQLGAAVRGLSPDTKARLKAQWAAMSPDQKAALKSMNLRALWQQLVARFQAMGPTERAIAKKLLGQAVDDGSQGRP
jgi:hypothetical protein